MAAVAALVLAVGVLGAEAPSRRLRFARIRRWLCSVLSLAGAALLIAAFAASRASPSATAAAKGPRFAILFASSWDGSSEIFAADPTGSRPVGQVTFAPGLSVADPLPSPNGQGLLYKVRSDQSASSTLWLARADGSAARVITTNALDLGDVAWSPDSGRFAYLVGCCQVGSSSPREALHVVSADGSIDRVIDSSRTLNVGDTIVWGPDGRHVHLAAWADGSPSPDRRWTARWNLTFDGGTIDVDRAATGRRVAFLDAAWSPAWSPNSRFLAYATKDGISVLDPRSGRTHLLSHDVGTQLAWSPGGRLLAYVQGAEFLAPGDLRTVTLDGHVRIVVAANGRYGGPISAFAWARVPTGVRYRAPSPVTGVFTGWPVTALAADGDRVAYATCAGVFTWDLAAAQAIQVAKPALSNNCTDVRHSHEHVASVALASDRLAYADQQGGNTTFWSVRGVSLGTTPQPFTLASSGNTCCLPPPEVAGSGGLLAFATRRPKDPGSPSVLVWQIQTVGPGGCPCQEISTFEQPTPDRFFHLDDVDAGRLVANGGGSLRILDSGGTPLLDLPLQPSEAALSGDDLAVHIEGELRDYSAPTGTLLHTWALAPAPSAVPSVLQDVAHGLAAYVVNGELHVLRLSDGSDAVVGPGNLARFTDSGLVETAGPRIQLIPYGKLPLH